jgi:hypothetical protein
VRHLLFSYQHINPETISLYDFVDTFSDIDLVVDRDSDWPNLQQAIGGSLPFSGFHRWEVEELERVVAVEKSYVSFPIDRIIVWIDGREADSEAIQVKGLAINVESVISSPTLDPDLSAHFHAVPESGMAAVLTLLRFGRYYFQFPQGRSQFTPETMERSLPGPREITHSETAVALNLKRVELAVLHVMFNARELRQAISFLNDVSRRFPPVWFERSRILRTFSSERFANANLIGAAVYTPSSSLPLRARLFTRKGAVARASGEVNSVVPWTILSSLGEQERGCCRYRDFSAGPAVIAWRDVSAGPLLRGLGNLENYGVVARLQGSAGYNGSPPTSSMAVPIPGFVHVGSAIAIRLDHGYVRAISSGNAVFSVGVVRTMSGEGRQG